MKIFLSINGNIMVKYIAPGVMTTIVVRNPFRVTSSLLCKFIRTNTVMVWLVVSYVPSTARSFRDGTPFTVHCKGREARLIHRTHRESNPGPSRGSPLHYRCATPAPPSWTYRAWVIPYHSPLHGLLSSGSSPVSWCDDHERDKSVWSCTSRRRVKDAKNINRVRYHPIMTLDKDQIIFLDTSVI